MQGFTRFFRISFLHKELTRVVTENRNMQKKISEIEMTLTKKIALLRMKNNLLRLKLAERHRWLGKYENFDVSFFTDSRYNAERIAFRKRMEGRTRTGDMTT